MKQIILITVFSVTFLTTISISNQSSEFHKLITNRPQSDLETLTARSDPNLKGDVATDSFYDILKLRDTKDSNAVSVLEQVLAGHVNSTRIHGYAAAQALFCIDTPKAHEILTKYLLTKNYNCRLGINYTSPWEMQEPQRSNFIRQYHLKNLSKDMSLKLNAKSHNDKNGQRIEFELVIQNISLEAYRILDEQIYKGLMLYFQSEQDATSIVTANRYIKYKHLPPEWIEIKPGETHKFQININIMKVDKLKYRYNFISKDSIVVAQTRDIVFDIKKPGKFKVYAMYEIQPLTAAQLDYAKIDNPWSGRVVSKPVEVIIKK